MNDEGYLRPVVLHKLQRSENARIEALCPGARVEHGPNAVPRDPLWGPLVRSRTGAATDGAVRRQGSSGGVISALAIFLLESKKVDFVAQIAASTSDPLANELQLSYSAEDVLRAAGSRYGPSAPLRQMRELLGSGKRFAFVGKPCDVAALRRYMQTDPAISQQIPYLLSFICAGVPSLEGTHKVIEKLGADRTQLASFRYRGDGWPGMARAVQQDGQVFEMDYSTSWGTILNRHLQFRCKICPDGTGEFADVTCADAWYGKDGYPDFAERDGRSMVLSRSEAGEALVREAVAAGAITVEDLGVGEIAKMQPYQAERKKMVLGRVMATRLALGFAPRYRRLGLWRSSLMVSPLAWLKNAGGTYRRIHRSLKTT
ncbi:Coenzyme F420 hydrogenase/dehydrogenase, beta subunit C-terminal domain [Niveibacterium sp. SC-1]|uniref:Coenzyme F420 hydrogenase/dehydrogenase, beta subunit C-terminal domain n=1 Tax=Niveibacterium sp. SC-1 TaxID=3135646 RepID=UPI00311F835E